MNDPRIARLRELALAVADGRISEFTMRIPADPNRDADLVIDWAGKRIAELEALIRDCDEMTDATWPGFASFKAKLRAALSDREG